jgi:hypothetical protein
LVKKRDAHFPVGLTSLRSGSSSGVALLVDPRQGYHFFAFEVFRWHPGKKQILTSTNKFARQNFFFLQQFFSFGQKRDAHCMWVAYSPKNLPAAA